MPAPETLVGTIAVDPENKILVKEIGGAKPKIDVRQWWLPEDATEFAPGKGLRFPQNLGPGVALSVLKASKDELAKNPKALEEIIKLCQGALGKKAEVV